MTRPSIRIAILLALALAACSGSSASPTDMGNPSHGDDDDGGGGGDDDDDGGGGDDGPPVITGYTQSTIATDCETLPAPQQLELLAFIHATDAIDLPKTIPFFDTTRTRVSVAEEGYLMLFDSNNADITTLTDPAQIPAASAPNGLVSLLWEGHLRFVTDRTTILLDHVSDHAVIEWHDFGIGVGFPDAQSHITMQAKLFDDGAIEMHYCELDAGTQAMAETTGANASVGIESPDGSKGVSTGFKQAVVGTDQAFRYTPVL